MVDMPRGSSSYMGIDEGGNAALLAAEMLAIDNDII
jgi:phosphoribosylcarboxyaminoimidazole (NCAIR) mutase